MDIILLMELIIATIKITLMKIHIIFRKKIINFINVIFLVQDALNQN